MKKQTISLTHVPRCISETILQKCNQFKPGSNPIYVNRLPNPSGTINKCIYNVQAYINSHPGEMLLGWEVCIWENVLIQCIGHAIVKHNEELFCVTPSKYGDTRLLFLPDSTLMFDFNNPNERMPSIKLPISNSPEVLRFIEIDHLEYEILCKYPVGKNEIVVHGKDATELMRLRDERQKLLEGLLRK